MDIFTVDCRVEWVGAVREIGWEGGENEKPLENSWTTQKSMNCENKWWKTFFFAKKITIKLSTINFKFCCWDKRSKSVRNSHSDLQTWKKNPLAMDEETSFNRHGVSLRWMKKPVIKTNQQMHMIISQTNNKHFILLSNGKSTEKPRSREIPTKSRSRLFKPTKHTDKSKLFNRYCSK